MPALLTSCLSSLDTGSFLLIEDSLQHDGRQLLFAMIRHTMERVDEVHFVTTEVHSDKIRSVLGSNITSQLIVHDYWSNPLGWNVTEDHDPLRLDNHEDLLSRIKRSSRTSKPSKIIVAVDAISSFLSYKTDSFSCTSLWSLVNGDNDSELPGIYMFGLVHSDLHSEKTINALRYLANVRLRLLPDRPASITPLNDDANGTFEIIVNKKGGKVKRQREVYCVHDKLVSLLHHEHHGGSSPYEDFKPDPTANLTFNLSLKDSEKKAKENVVLPYTARLDKTPETSQSQIFYEPDDADDFDEEDPDDDLDI